SRGEKIEQRSFTAKIFGKLDYWATMLEDWVARNQKVIFTIIGIVILAVLGYLAYTKFIVEPRQKEAVNEMSQSMNYYNRALQLDPGPNQDTLFLNAINGAGGYGLVDIAENYNGTDAANIAHYLTGMAYLRMGKYKKAVDELEQYKGADEITGPLAKGAIGDAFINNDQPKDALRYYEKAAQMRDNDFTT